MWWPVQGVMRRGMQVPALREFILSQGASKNVTVQEWDKIWTMNKKVWSPLLSCATVQSLQFPYQVTQPNLHSAQHLH